MGFAGWSLQVPNQGACAGPGSIIIRTTKTILTGVRYYKESFRKAWTSSLERTTIPRIMIMERVMTIANPARVLVPLLLGVMLLAGVPAFAQVDFTGVWNPRVGDED